ncbi:hypothetical protein HYPSUDRAFT_42506 [Hypholoma sublateritium FD-334 SS-4]|uniref:Uncharacterized protein n=1 Tax=Hypholoma sublateritium (strain FD-334 SS-4) TaxID=945553 RepID=A0A0D2NQ69_HYPSF|nr:hypothetical protein HYPSUDRAFT_42506 [Hypholoma sublateritium FD-334 SS-4]
MPDVTIRNETPHVLNIAFRFVAPAYWTNALIARESWTPHLASALYTIEIRVDNGRNRFSAEGAWATAGDITTGWLAGAAGVVSIVGGGFFGRGAALPLLNHAVRAGGRFAKDSEGMVVTVGGVLIALDNKTYAVRYDEDAGYSLCDVTAGERA